MQNKVLSALRRCRMVFSGDTVICAVSGGADSMALLWCMWMLRQKLGITVEAAHFNHHLRAAESDRDEQFVRDFCAFHDIPLHVGEAHVVPGKKGLEAAARDARYSFLRSLNGTIATAHTADDNAETVLLHLIRGTSLRGLGGIAPKSPGLIRPMLDVTRVEVEAYLAEHWIGHVEDSSNHTDLFLRNRLRRNVLPLLKQENPSLSGNLSAMAQRLRQDEQTLSALADSLDCTDVASLRKAEPALRRRAVERLLTAGGLAEPNASHIAQAESLIFAESPSAFAVFPVGVTLRREYGKLLIQKETPALEPVTLSVGEWAILSTGVEVHIAPAEKPVDTPDSFTVAASGPITIRPRQPGDAITRPGGTKTLKKRFIDQKIPAPERLRIPVAADEQGVLGVQGIGANLKRTQGEPLVTITFVQSGQAAEIDTNE